MICIGSTKYIEFAEDANGGFHLYRLHNLVFSQAYSLSSSICISQLLVDIHI